MRYFIEMSYRGTAYNGWQIQDNAPSVQQTLQQSLSTILRTPTEAVGAGRTDTGVHAHFYVAHFDTAEPLDDTAAFRYHLNALLPFDIAVRRIYKVRDDVHARFSATMREYEYHLCRHKNPFTRDTCWQLNTPLDIYKMNEAAVFLLGCDDFTSFAKLGSGNKNNICKIYSAKWTSDGDEMIFTIRADRFLRNMVRAIVGTLVDVGKGKIAPARFKQILDARDLSLSSSSAPACGLFLNDVRYPNDITIF